jgi:predicted nucleotidyltransferase
MTSLADDIDTEALLQQALQRLVAAAPVERIILFGSRARGDYNSASDFDICVILDDDIAAGTFTPVLWRTVSDLGLPIQILPLQRSAFDAAKRDVTALAMTSTAMAASCLRALRFCSRHEFE